MTTPDLSVCPNCGERDFPLVSIERVEAYAPIEREGSPDLHRDHDGGDVHRIERAAADR